MNDALSAKQKLVKLFIGLVVRILISHYTFKTLEFSETSGGMLTKSAPQFFNLLNEMFIRDFYLESVKITDNPTSCGRENLTVSTIVNRLDWEQEQQRELVIYKEKLEKFRPYLVTARNRIIAHNDRLTYEADHIEGIGGFDEGLDMDFIVTLEEFCNYIHKETFGEIWGRFIPSSPGDVKDLIADLTKARAYDLVFYDPQTCPEIKSVLLRHRLSCLGGE